MLEKVEFKRNREGKVNGFIIADVGRVRNIRIYKNRLTYYDLQICLHKINKIDHMMKLFMFD